MEHKLISKNVTAVSFSNVEDILWRMDTIRERANKYKDEGNMEKYYDTCGDYAILKSVMETLGLIYVKDMTL